MITFILVKYGWTDTPISISSSAHLGRHFKVECLFKEWYIYACMKMDVVKFSLGL